MEHRLLVIGLDGATWDVLMPLVEGGGLRVLGWLVRGGSWGVLESVVPPVTGGAWLSMATGKNPGKTGVIDFLNRRDASYKLHPVSSRDFKGCSFWDYLSAAGRRVGIFNYPMLFPPYEINGFMVSGIGVFPEGEITYPPSLKRELDEVSGGYEIHLEYNQGKYDDLDLFMRDLDRFMGKFERVVGYLVRDKEWDLLFLVFSMTDWVQHIMWRHVDEGHPMYDPDSSPKYKQRFVEFWRRVDGVIGGLVETAGENTVTFIVSDHGFGINDQTFNLAKWLEVKGYLTRRRGALKGRIKRLAYRVAVRLARTPLRRVFSPKTRRKIANVLRARVEVEIDFERSKAYCLGHTAPFGAVYINARSLEEREEVKERVISDLRNISEDVGRKVSVEVYEPREMYHGERNAFLPDIIFTVNDWRCTVVEDFNRPLFEERPLSARHTGTHRPNGIFLAYGPGIRRGFKIRRVSIYDVAPTILHMFGLPIPGDMDGRVLMDIFEDGSDFARRKPRRVSPGYYVRMLEAGKARKVARKLRRGMEG